MESGSKAAPSKEPTLCSRLDQCEKATEELKQQILRLRSLSERIGGPVPIQSVDDPVPPKTNLLENTGQLANQLEDHVRDIRHAITRLDELIG